MGVDSLPPDIVRFLKSNLPAFYALDSHDQPEWLKELAEKTIKEFALPKENDVRNLSDYRKAITRWIYNKNTSAARKKYADYKPVNISVSQSLKPGNSNSKGKTLRKFSLVQTPSARVLYGQDKNNSARITATAGARVKAWGNEVSYVKIWNQVLDEEWNQLSEEQRGPYFVEAEERKVTLSGPPTEEQIYQNQDRFSEDLMKSLQDLLGFEKGYQIGNASLHVQGFYRGREDKAKSFSFVICPPGIPPLDDQTEYPTAEVVKSWSDYAFRILPAHAYPKASPRTSPPSVSFKYDIEDAPLLPSEVRTTQSDLANIIYQYISESWDNHWRYNNLNVKPSFPWNSFITKPTEYMFPCCIPAGITITDPLKMSAGELYLWYTHLYQLQERRINSGECQILFRGHNRLLAQLNYDNPVANPITLTDPTGGTVSTTSASGPNGFPAQC